MLVEFRLQCTRHIFPVRNVKSFMSQIREVHTRDAPLLERLLVAPAIIWTIGATAVEHDLSARRACGRRINIDSESVHLAHFGFSELCPLINHLSGACFQLAARRSETPARNFGKRRQCLKQTLRQSGHFVGLTFHLPLLCSRPSIRLH